MGEIEAMIPRGSQEPNYADRLKFAFGNEKKIAKQKTKLKEVQHMFMFMTTCWMYQLPSMQQPKSTDSSPQIPMGSFQGMMEQIPVQINMRDPNMSSTQNVSYEATLTLKPIPQATPVYSLPPQGQGQMGPGPSSSGRSSEPERKQERMIFGRNERFALENMRRSPYFSEKLLKKPAFSYAERLKMELEKESLEKVKKEEEAKYYREDGRTYQSAPRTSDEPKPLSREAASAGVETLLSEVCGTTPGDFRLLTDTYHLVVF